MALRWTPEELEAYQRRRRGETPAREKKKPLKYRNERVSIDGMKFDSRHEAEVYSGLQLLQKAGEIRCVCRQVSFDLPGGIRYVADFVTLDNDFHAEVYDAKSEITRKDRVYINKKKQMKAIYGIDIREA